MHPCMTRSCRAGPPPPHPTHTRPFPRSHSLTACPAPSPLLPPLPAVPAARWAATPAAWSARARCWPCWCRWTASTAPRSRCSPSAPPTSRRSWTRCEGAGGHTYMHWRLCTFCTEGNGKGGGTAGVRQGQVVCGLAGLLITMMMMRFSKHAAAWTRASSSAAGPQLPAQYACSCGGKHLLSICNCPALCPRLRRRCCAQDALRWCTRSVRPAHRHAWRSSSERLRGMHGSIALSAVAG